MQCIKLLAAWVLLAVIGATIHMGLMHKGPCCGRSRHVALLHVNRPPNYFHMPDVPQANWPGVPADRIHGRSSPRVVALSSQNTSSSVSISSHRTWWHLVQCLCSQMPECNDKQHRQACNTCTQAGIKPVQQFKGENRATHKQFCWLHRQVKGNKGSTRHHASSSSTSIPGSSSNSLGADSLQGAAGQGGSSTDEEGSRQLVSRTNRKLLQQLPYAREFNVNRLSRLASAIALDGTQDRAITALSGTELGIKALGVTFAGNGLLGGAAKGTDSHRATTDRETASTASTVNVSSISQPGFGVTTSRSGADTISLRQTALQSTSSSSSSSSSDELHQGPVPKPSGDDCNRRDFGILMSAATDYGIAGDATAVSFVDYSLSESREPYGLDYDYGQPHAVPQTSFSTTTVRSDLDSASGRAAVGSGTSAAVTADSSITRSHSTTSSLLGQMTYTITNDTFGIDPIITEPVPLVQSGTDAATAGEAKGYKLSGRPSYAYGRSTGNSAVQATTGMTGASSSIISHVAGVQGVNTDASTVAISSCAGLDFC